MDAAIVATQTPAQTPDTPASLTAKPDSVPIARATATDAAAEAASATARLQAAQPTASAPRAAVAPPEADFAAAPAAPQAEARPPARSPTPARAAFRPASRPPAARAAAGAASQPPARGAAELAAYRNALLAKIWGAVRYPESARERGASGVATVRFALDGVGAVAFADLAQSSGDRALDDEAVAAVRRASPLPAPPADAPRAYSAPIRFELR